MDAKQTGSLRCYDELNRFLTYCLKERNMKGILDMVTDDFYGVSTECSKIAYTKQDFEAILRAELHKIPASISFSISGYQEKSIADTVFTCLCSVNIFAGTPAVQARLSAVFQTLGGHCQISSIQMIDASSAIMTDAAFSANQKRQLLKEAMTDSLTGLYNRRAAVRLVNRHHCTAGIHGFLILDIDGFKEINDSYGHVMGDMVLNRLSSLLTGAFQEQNLCARMGGDEFIVFAPSVLSVNQMRDAAEQIRRRYIEEVSELCPKVVTGLSLGGICDSSPVDFDTLYALADSLLYDVKRTAKGGVKIQLLEHTAAPL